MKIFKYLILLLFSTSSLMADEKKERKSRCNGAIAAYNITKEQGYLDLYRKDKCWELEEPIKIKRTKDDEIEYLEGRVKELEEENRSLRRELKNK